MRIIVNSILFFMSFLFISSCGRNKENYQNTSQDNISYDIKTNISSDSVIRIAIKLIGSNKLEQSSLRHNQSREDYAYAVEYYNNYAKEDIWLNSCDSIIHPISYHFENNYNIVGYDVINVSFNIDRKRFCDQTFIFFNNNLGSPFKFILDNIK